MGDLNCKFGKYVRELPALSEIPNAHSYEYPVVSDCVNNPNDNAYVLSTICIDNKLLVLNNLKTPTNYFRSGKTYRKGENWISELDVCLVSCEAISKVKSFRVHNMESLPSDHAPISIDVKVPPISIDCLYKRACHLGGHASLISSEECDPLVRRPIKFSQVINDTFLVNVNSLDVSNYENVNDVNNFAQNISNVLYECARSSREVRDEGRVGVHSNSSLARWDRLLLDRNDRRVWQAINWKGCLQEDTRTGVRPTDEEFKNFYEELMGTARNNLTDEYRESSVSIPVLDDPITLGEVSTQVDNIKADKACGPDGIAPGVLKLLPLHWLMLILSLFIWFLL